MSTPLITIIMATYNRSEIVEESLISVASQTFKNFECVIIDDHSTDNSVEVISEFISDDPRFRLYKRQETFLKGLPGCRNFGLTKSRGRYILFFDDDDILHPDVLSITYDILKTQNASFCWFKRKTFKNEPEIIHAEEIPNFMFEINENHLYDILSNKLPFNSCQVLWKRDCFAKNKFNEQLMYAEEWECYSRIICSGINGLGITNTLIFARKHELSNTGEYFNKSNIRIDSHIKAMKLVIDTLRSKNLFDFRFKHLIFNMLCEMYETSRFNRYLKEQTGIVEFMFWYLYFQFKPLRLVLYRLRNYSFLK